MQTYKRSCFAAVLAGATVVFAAGNVWAQCSELTSGLRFPLGIAGSNQGNLLVAETGTAGIPNSGRISVLGLDGNRRTLLDGLPSGANDVGDPSGPAGLFMRGRTLYVVIGIGDSGLPGPAPLTLVQNPHPSSPLFSSVLAIHFSASVEERTGGFVLAQAHHSALAGGQKVELASGGGDRLTIEMVTNLPDSTPAPLPGLPLNIRGSNPFALVALGDQFYVTDGGQNVVWRIDAATGDFGVLASFSPVANPLPFGPPSTDAVPTGIRLSNGELLVTLFTGFPFAPGTSVVERVDAATGTHTTFLTGLTTAIDVLPVTTGHASSYLVLQHASAPVLSGPGQLIEIRDGVQTVAESCLTRPTSMTEEKKTGTLYVTEILNGRVVVLTR
jgi:hypothetical protein